MIGRFSPCLDTIYEDTKEDEALRALAALGFRRFEFWDWRRRDIEGLARLASELGLSVAIFSGNTFDEPLVEPDAHERAMAHLRRSLQVARRLGTRLLVVHVGYAIPRHSRAGQWAAAVAGLRAAGALAGAEGVTLAVEPLNSKVDHPGYFLDALPDAEQLIEEVDHPAIRLLLDVYHMGVMHDDLLDHLGRALAWTVHLHVADVPGRGEPGSGAVQWPRVAHSPGGRVRGRHRTGMPAHRIS